MAVQVADTMKAKNNLDFPIVESQDIKGGLHCVTSIAERDKLLQSEKKQAGMLVYVAGSDGTKGVTYQMSDDMMSFHVFAGDLTSEQLQSILDYVQKNFESSKFTEEEGQAYLELL